MVIYQRKRQKKKFYSWLTLSLVLNVKAQMFSSIVLFFLQEKLVPKYELPEIKVSW